MPNNAPGPGAAQNGQPDQPINAMPGAGTDGGTVVQNPDGTGETIEPPVPFTQTNCQIMYPFLSGNPATNVQFNESSVLAAYSPSGSVTATPGMTLSAWYSDEHALTLGIRQIVVITAQGSTVTNYPVTALNVNPGYAFNPAVGATQITGDQAGVDTATCPGVPYVCSRPMYPALFVTDITANPASTSGDWQSGGKPIPPHSVLGTWKAAVRTLDLTGATATSTIAVDADPMPNRANLGGVPAPTGVGSEGYSAVLSWDINSLGLLSGHTYRLQFMVHDGDQNKSGGDVGENCVNVAIP